MSFSYHRAIAPMMWVLVVLASCELVVVHFLVSLWNRPVALVLSALSLATLVWLVATIRSFRSLPVQVGDDRVVMRVGRLKSIDLTAEMIAVFRKDWDAAAIKDRSVLNLALIAFPNVVIDLVEPVRVGRRSVRAVAHRLDDPAAFVAAVEGLKPAHDR